MSISQAFKKVTPNFIANKFEIEVFGMFSYGSVVYCNKIPDDFDYIIISDKKIEQTVFQLDNFDIQLTFYTVEEFQNMINDQEITALECYFLSKIENKPRFVKIFTSDVVESIFSSYQLDKLKLRSSISKKSSNSYVKAKKKVLVEEHLELSVSLKSLWHSIRMVEFAILICKNELNDFTVCNDLYQDIYKDYTLFLQIQDPNDFWNHIHKKYKPIHNLVLSNFRATAPKQ